MTRLALTALAVVALLAAIAGADRYDRAPRSGFEATTRGAVTMALSGRAALSPTAIELESVDGDATLLLQWRFSAPPEPGTYATDIATGSHSLHALLIVGPDSAPSGVFRARRGTLWIRHRSPRLVTGTFEVIATRLPRGTSPRDRMSVRIAGSFIATHAPR